MVRKFYRRSAANQFEKCRICEMSLYYDKSVVLENWPWLLFVVLIAIFWQQRQKSQSQTQNQSLSTLDGGEYIGDFQPDIDAIPSADDADRLLSHLEDKPHVPFPGATKTLGTKGAEQIYRILNDRRSVRQFSRRSVNLEVIRTCILAAGIYVMF